MLELGQSSAQLHRIIGERAGELGISHVFALGNFASAIIGGARDSGVPHAEVLPDHAAVARAMGVNGCPDASVSGRPPGSAGEAVAV